VTRLLLRRFGAGVLILWLASLLVFVATQLLPGDAAQSLLGRYATPESVAALRRQMHLDQPPVLQYWQWLIDLVTGRWGTSLVSQELISHIVSRSIENTAILAVLTTVVATPLALAVGTASALRSEGGIDHVISVFTLALAAIPAFVIGIALIYVFATSVFHILPPASIVDPSKPIWQQPAVVVLPTLTLVLGVAPYPIRMIRASMIEVLQSDYVLMARLKGLPERRVVLLHALPNAIAPTIQATALTLLFLAGGVVVVETVFGYPGLGRALVEAVNDRDIPLVQTLTVMLAAFYVTVNLVADLLVILVTPRQRASATGVRG
jgi:peptide/nickel transport system permease protein